MRSLCLVSALLVLNAAMVQAHQGDGSATSLIHACVHPSNGNVRLVGPTGTCKLPETPVHWPATNPAPAETNLSGTWAIVNETVDETYAGSIGQITFFSNGTFTIDSGRFAAAGIVSASEPVFCLIPLNPIEFKSIGNSVVYVHWTGETRPLPPPGGPPPPPAQLPQDALITIVNSSANRLTLTGLGGCGGAGAPRISHLEKIQ